MKKFVLTLAVFTLVFNTSCKDKKTTETEANEAPTEVVASKQFVVKPEATKVTWTAYKTTAKTPVGGEFATLNFEEKSGETPQDALNNLTFSIPVSSLMTKDVGRDSKLKASFFGAMLDTEFLTGTLKYSNDKYTAFITMNGVTNQLPLEVEITDERRVKMTTTMDLKKWNALEALESLNKVCFDLHKGADGVSKTWEDVAIEINTFLREN